MSRTLRAWTVAAAGVILFGLVGCGTASPAVVPAPTGSAVSSAPTTASAPAADRGPRPLPRRAPVEVASVAIPAVGLTTPALEHLRLLDDQTLASPEDPDRAGWYADGVIPGEPGPAVIAGHVDSKTGPAVFAELDRVTRGELITVTLGDGTATRFRVDSVVHTAKDAFPTNRVYGPTPDPQLRLITCSGPYVGERGYTDNTIVFASRADAG